MLHVDILVEENLGAVFELVGVFCGEIASCAALGAVSFDFGVAGKVGLQTVCHVFSLRNDAHAGLNIFQYLGHEQWVMGASKYDGVNLWVYAHQCVYPFLDEVVCARTICLVVLDDGHPQGACYSRHGDIRIEFLYFQPLAVALDGAFGGE